MPEKTAIKSKSETTQTSRAASSPPARVPKTKEKTFFRRPPYCRRHSKPQPLRRQKLRHRRQFRPERRPGRHGYRQTRQACRQDKPGHRLRQRRRRQKQHHPQRHQHPQHTHHRRSGTTCPNRRDCRRNRSAYLHRHRHRNCSPTLGSSEKQLRQRRGCQRDQPAKGSNAGVRQKCRTSHSGSCRQTRQYPKLRTVSGSQNPAGGRTAKYGQRNRKSRHPRNTRPSKRLPFRKPKPLRHLERRRHRQEYPARGGRRTDDGQPRRHTGRRRHFPCRPVFG